MDESLFMKQRPIYFSRMLDLSGDDHIPRTKPPSSNSCNQSLEIGLISIRSDRISRILNFGPSVRVGLGAVHVDSFSPLVEDASAETLLNIRK